MQVGSTFSFVVPDTAALRPGQQFLQVLRSSVAPGVYTLAVRLQPEIGQGVVLERRLDVPATRGALSDVLLASDIRTDDGGPAVLRKNGMQLAPNAGLLFGKGVDNLVRFWVGENGFGPFLERLRQGDGVAANTADSDGPQAMLASQ